MIPRRVLGIVILAWALLSWGGRVGLLTGPESGDLVVWFRIAGSLATAAIVGLALLASASWLGPAAWLYAVVAGVVWSTSLVSVWTDPTTGMAFRLVHSALAAVSVSLAVLAVRESRQPAGTSADSADGIAAVN